jgi:hypothetical protein
MWLGAGMTGGGLPLHDRSETSATSAACNANDPRK